MNRFAGREVVPESSEGLAQSHEWHWFMCLSLFRVAGILAGVGSRAKAGNASAQNASVVGSTQVVSQIIDTAIGLIKPSQVQVATSDRHLRFQFLKHKARIFVDSYVMKWEATLLAHCESADKWTAHPLVGKLKQWAKSTGLWNCFLSHDLVQVRHHSFSTRSLALSRSLSLSLSPNVFLSL